MDPVLSLLFSVADGVGEDDLKKMKFLVTGMDGINTQKLESASTTDFIFMLKEAYDMTFFGELLREIGRPKLCEKLNTYYDTRSSRRLPEVKVLMFRIAQSMTEPDLQSVAFHLDVNGEDCDAIGLMRLVETRKAVASREDLRQVVNEFGMSCVFDKALKKTDAEDKEVVKNKPATSVARMSSFCDETGCDQGCPYRTVWSDKFPRKSTPMFSSERLLSHDDLSTDGEDTVEELLGEGAFGKVYKGQ